MKVEVKEVLEDGSQALELLDGTGETHRVVYKNETLFWGPGPYSGLSVPTHVEAVLYRALYEDQVRKHSKEYLGRLEAESTLAVLKRGGSSERLRPALVIPLRVKELERLGREDEQRLSALEQRLDELVPLARGRLQGRLDYIVDELKRRQDFILQRMDEASLTGVMDAKVTAWDDAAGTEVEPG